MKPYRMARLYALRPPPELERLRNKKPPNLVYSRHHFLCEVPSRLNAAQRHKLEEFAALCDENVNPLRKGFFAKAKEFFQ